MFLSGDNPLLGDKYGTRADEFLFGKEGETIYIIKKDDK